MAELSNNLKILEALTQKLLVQENQMKAFFELAIDIMVIANSTHFTMCNPAWTTETGWTQKDMNERPWRSLLHPEDAARTEVVSERLAALGDVNRFKNRYRCKNGSYISLDWNSRPDITAEFYYCTARVVSRG